MLSTSLTSYIGSRLKLTTKAATGYLSTSSRQFSTLNIFNSQCKLNNRCLCQRCTNTNNNNNNSSSNIYKRSFSTKNNKDVDNNKQYDFESLENDPYDEVENVNPDIKVDPLVADRIRINRSSIIKPMPLDPKERDAQSLEHMRNKNQMKFPHEYSEQFDRELFGKIRDPTRDDLDQYEVRNAVPLPEADEQFNHPRITDDWAAEEFDDEEDQEDEVPLDDEDNYAEFETDRFQPYIPARPMQRVENTLDGVAHGYSKRKDARAVAFVRIGSGELSINGRTLADYFGNCIAYKDTVLRPLVITETLVKWDIEIRVHGGGIKGQAEAICRALALAISNYDLGYRMALKFSGLLKHDIRRVERKKPGQLKARKKFPLVKR